jgi:hypothetical protein
MSSFRTIFYVLFPFSFLSIDLFVNAFVCHRVEPPAMCVRVPDPHFSSCPLMSLIGQRSKKSGPKVGHPDIVVRGPTL